VKNSFSPIGALEKQIRVRIKHVWIPVKAAACLTVSAVKVMTSGTEKDNMKQYLYSFHIASPTPHTTFNL
jgi:hypothetical protein